MKLAIDTSAALLTPFRPDGSIDWQRFAAHARGLLDTGMKVVTAFGTTGEGVSVGQAERFELADRFAAAGIAPSRLVECVYGPAAPDAGRHVRRSLAAGCAGILLTPPFYFKPVGEEGVFRWYAEVFEAAGGECRDIILYNLPALTGVTIGAGLTGRLRRAFPGIIAGVKDSGGDWDHTAALLAEHRDLIILVGHEGHLAKAVRHGASGAISGIANIAPRLVAGLVGGRDDPRIEGVLRRLLAMPVVPAIKAVMAAQTGDAEWARVRAPLVAIGEPGELAVAAELAAMLA